MPSIKRLFNFCITVICRFRTPNAGKFRVGAGSPKFGHTPNSHTHTLTLSRFWSRTHKYTLCPKQSQAFFNCFVLPINKSSHSFIPHLDIHITCLCLILYTYFVENVRSYQVSWLGSRCWTRLAPCKEGSAHVNGANGEW
jgi:hypothetical protein